MSIDFVKNKYFFILLIIAVLLAGGVFYWQSQKPTPPDKWDEAEVSQREDYKITKKKDGLLVENEKAGLSLELPRGWNRIEGVTYTSFLSPEFKQSTSSNILKSGCKISLKISNINTDIEALKRKQKDKFDWETLILNEFKEINLDDKKSLKHKFQDEKMKMYFVGLHIPADNKLYEIVLDSAIKDKEKCEEEFNKVLDSVSIQ